MKKNLLIATLIFLSSCCSQQKPICCETMKQEYHPVVYFEHNRAELSSQDMKILKKLAMHLKKCPHLKVNITGYTDNTGTTDYNIALGSLRAQSVELYLQSLNISPDIIHTTSMGEKDPAASNETEEGKSQNRRAVIHLK